jgi:hypothetical protein
MTEMYFWAGVEYLPAETSGPYREVASIEEKESRQPRQES